MEGFGFRGRKLPPECGRDGGLHAIATSHRCCPPRSLTSTTASRPSRVGVIWDGEDRSVSEGKRFTWKIDNIVDDGTNLAISWSATFDGSPINPCNTTASGDRAGGLPVRANTANEGTLEHAAQLRAGR